MLFDQGTLEKMTVRAYLPTTAADQQPQVSEAPEDAYTVQVNPNSYSLNQTIDYAARQGQGASGSDAVYSRSPARTVSFTFIFDATGVVPTASPLAGVPLAGAIASALGNSEEFIVNDEIARFNRVVYDYDGEMHRPRKVLLLWGSFSFSGALTALTYDFKLFKPDGTPLRATANCTFREAHTETERTLIEGDSSPDLNHRSTVKEGDTLPLMAHRIYGDARHYISVARFNRLVNFRRLKPGTEVELPRLADKEAGG